MDRRGADMVPSGRGDASQPAFAPAASPRTAAAAPPPGRPQRTKRAAAAAAAQQLRAAEEEDALAAAEEAEDARPPVLPAWLTHELRVEVEGDPREGFPETYCAAVVARAELDEGGCVLVEYEEVRGSRVTGSPRTGAPDLCMAAARPHAARAWAPRAAAAVGACHRKQPLGRLLNSRDARPRAANVAWAGASDSPHSSCGAAGVAPVRMASMRSRRAVPTLAPALLAGRPVCRHPGRAAAGGGSALAHAPCAPAAPKVHGLGPGQGA
jgi:hypothetical protein